LRARSGADRRFIFAAPLYSASFTVSGIVDGTAGTIENEILGTVSRSQKAPKKISLLQKV
jgi:hypothetical protein